MAFDLEQFERHTYGRRIAEASNDLFALLEELETHYGAFERGLKASAWKGATDEQFREHVVTRIASASAPAASPAAARSASAAIRRDPGYA